MKKACSALCALVLLFGIFFTATPLSAASVDGAYSATEVFGAFGHHPYTADEFFFRDGVWTLEYYDTASKTFAPMTIFCANPLEKYTVTWSNFYTATEASLLSQGPETYCCVGTGGKMHPGSGASSVLTFVAPADGVLSYQAVLKAYGSANTKASNPENYGTTLSLRVNDGIVWPADGAEAVLTYDLGDVSLVAEGISVKQGDRVRLVVGARNGEHKNKGINFSSYPLVTYQSDSVSSAVSGSPVTYYENETAPGTGRISWSPVKNAVGYHVYVQGVRVNETMVRGLSFSLSDETVSAATVTAVGPDGRESAPSAPGKFLSKLESVPSSPEGICYRRGDTMYTQNGSYSLLPPEPAPAPENPAASGPELPVSSAEVTENLQGAVAVGGAEDSVSPTVSLPEDTGTGSDLATGTKSGTEKETPGLWVWIAAGGLAVAIGAVTVILLLRKKSASTNQ